MDVYVVIFMFMLLFCVIAVCALLLREERKQQQQKRKKIKHTKIIKEIYRARLLFFHFLPPDKCECGKIYVCILLACLLYIAFSISVLPVLCFFFGERKRIARHVSLIFRLKMYGSIVLGALSGFDGLKFTHIRVIGLKINM